jgi:hypothetical protein
MNYNNMKGILLSEFPELINKCIEYSDSWDFLGEEGSHTVYGDLINKYVVNLLKENKDLKAIKKIFDFYERMAICEDEKVRNVLEVTLLEYLWDEKTTYDNALKYMGEETAKIFKGLNRYLRIPTKDLTQSNEDVNVEIVTENMPIIYFNMKVILLSEFPELIERYIEVSDSYDFLELGPHVVYGDLLNRYVADLLRENKDLKAIKKIFDFYERMATCEDEKVRNVLEVTLLEYLWDEKITYENALKYMEEETVKIFKGLNVYLRVPTK